MANNMRWREGDTNPVAYKVDAAVGVEIGDLLYEAAGYVFPAAMMGAPAGKLRTHESGIMAEMFATHFAGVAMQASPVGTNSNVHVATTGVFEFDMGSYNVLGDGVPAKGNPVRIQLSADGQPLNQSVNFTSSPSKKIGYLWKTGGVGRGRALVEIKVPIRNQDGVMGTDGQIGTAGTDGCDAHRAKLEGFQAEVERLKAEVSDLTFEAAMTMQVQTLAYVELQEKYSKLQDSYIEDLKESLEAHFEVVELRDLVKKYETLAEKLV